MDDTSQQRKELLPAFVAEDQFSRSIPGAKSGSEIMQASHSTSECTGLRPELPSSSKAPAGLNEESRRLHLPEGDPSAVPHRPAISSEFSPASTSDIVKTLSSSPSSSAFQRLEPPLVSQNPIQHLSIMPSSTSSFSVSEVFGSMRQQIYAGESYPFDKAAPSSDLYSENVLSTGNAGSEVSGNHMNHAVTSSGFSTDSAFSPSGRETLPSSTTPCPPNFRTFLGSLGLGHEMKGVGQPSSGSGIGDRETPDSHMDPGTPRPPSLVSSSLAGTAPSSSSPSPMCDTTTAGVSKFSCNICHKDFRQQASLLVHMRVHSGDRPYRCNTCNKTFNQAANLIAHQRTHTGERPFQCMECSKRFTQQGNLMTHMRTHSKEKPYECDVCHKSFSQAGNLKTHQRIHLGLRPYQCPHCSMDFTQLSGLQSHMRSKHNISELPRRRRRSDQQTPSSTVSADSTSSIDVIHLDGSDTESMVTTSQQCQTVQTEDGKLQGEGNVEQTFTNI